MSKQRFPSVQIDYTSYRKLVHQWGKDANRWLEQAVQSVAPDALAIQIKDSSMNLKWAANESS